MSEGPREEFLRTGGTPCVACGSTALACQHSFRVFGTWCCGPCRTNGAAQMHVEPDLDDHGSQE